jgi:hypothetical protein
MPVGRNRFIAPSASPSSAIKRLHDDLQRFEHVNGRIDKVDGRLDHIDRGLRALRTEMPKIVSNALRDVHGSKRRKS